MNSPHRVMACLYSINDHPKDYVSLNAYDKDYIKKHGFLGCGFEGGYGIAEVFMMQVALFDDPIVEIEFATKGIDLDAIFSTKTLYAACGSNECRVNDIFDRIFNKCVFHGFYFDNFLKKCAETKFMDNWFMSERFMSNVWAGSIRGQWNITFHHEANGKEPYRNRFRAFIKSLDDRGLGWTDKYLENDDFWGDKEAYWL